MTTDLDELFAGSGREEARRLLRQKLWADAGAFFAAANEAEKAKVAQAADVTRSEMAQLVAALGAYTETARRLARLLVTAAQDAYPERFAEEIALARNERAEAAARINEIRARFRAVIEAGQGEAPDRPTVR